MPLALLIAPADHRPPVFGLALTTGHTITLFTCKCGRAWDLIFEGREKVNALIPEPRDAAPLALRSSTSW